MKEGKRSEVIHDALNLLDEELIADVDRLRGDRENRKKVYHWGRWAGLAASICILVIAGHVWTNSSLNGENSAPLPNMNGGAAPETENGRYEEPESAVSIEQFIAQYDEENQTGNESDEFIPFPEQEVSSEHASTGNESMESTSTENISTEDASTEEESENNSGVFQTGEDIYRAILGLKENFTSLSVMRHEEWTKEDADSIIIDEKYQVEIDKLIEAMYAGECGDAGKIEVSDEEEIYHLFFTKKDGSVVHCWLFADGIICYNEMPQLYVKLDMETYTTVIDIFNGIQ